MVDLLRLNPYHIDTLLQVAEILKHQGDHTAAGDMIERALFAFDKSCHSLFNLTTGKVRLPFEYAENRSFYLTVFRHIANLARRGTWRTAFEFVKILLSLDPKLDSYEALTMIDVFAVKAKQYQYVIDLSRCDFFSERIAFLPNLHFSVAVAYCMADAEDSKAGVALQKAFEKFPWLANELSLQFRNQGWNNIIPPGNMQRVLAAMYMERAKDLWLDGKVDALLDDARSASSPSPVSDDRGVDLNLARHIILTDTPALLSLLPKKYTSRGSMASDPLPPNFDQPVTVENTIAGAHQVLRSFFSSLLPWHPGDRSQERLDRMMHTLEGQALDELDLDGEDAELMRAAEELLRPR